MADNHSSSTRSFNMMRIPNKNTQPELVVRKYLHSRGFRFRLHDRSLPGSPDIILARYRSVIFVNGCFWHGHRECPYASLPATRTNWWQHKIEKNRKRDLSAHRSLQALGWRVITVWTCALKPRKVVERLSELEAELCTGCV